MQDALSYIKMRLTYVHMQFKSSFNVITVHKKIFAPLHFRPCRRHRQWSNFKHGEFFLLIYFD